MLPRKHLTYSLFIFTYYFYFYVYSSLIFSLPLFLFPKGKFSFTSHFPSLPSEIFHFPRSPSSSGASAQTLAPNLSTRVPLPPLSAASYFLPSLLAIKSPTPPSRRPSTTSSIAPPSDPIDRTVPAPDNKEGPRREDSREDAPDPIVVELGSTGQNSRSEGAATFSPVTPLPASSAPLCFFSPATLPWSSDPIAPAAMEGLLTAGDRQGAPYSTVCLFPGRPSPPAALLVRTPSRAVTQSSLRSRYNAQLPTASNEQRISPKLLKEPFRVWMPCISMGFAESFEGDLDLL